MTLDSRTRWLALLVLLVGDLMIVLDDLALPCGKLRIRPAGSSGGHNGLKDIERALGTDQYPRLRIGIDPPRRAIHMEFGDSGHALILPRRAPARIKTQ